jgi:hypothetical protein
MTVDLQGGLATAMAAYENAINTFRLEDHV